ncbi:FHA domain-containing protein [Piscinibacter sakaiensis]|uniref:FHA domain-containing protein n=1 Tax=Piscinibacter sakaiensis TaxID=1547922 RepID=UPI00372A75B7
MGRRRPHAAAALPASSGSDSGRTERLVRRQIGIDPVVGWLVCLAGPERGADYRLHSERNFIGRGEGMDVRIASDKTVSRENHVSISFDPKKESFRLLPGGGRGLVYLNGEELVAPTPLADGDRIELGETLLLFVPLCGRGGFRWEAAPPPLVDAD